MDAHQFRLHGLAVVAPCACRVLAHIPASGTPMQSAAKVRGGRSGGGGAGEKGEEGMQCEVGACLKGGSSAQSLSAYLSICLPT